MCLWRINEDADEPYLINLWGLNRNGEIDWNVTIEDSTWGDRVITHNIIAAPDGQHFLFGGAFQNRDNYIVSYHLFWLDVENGEILWRRDMPEIYQRGFPTGYDRVFVSENALYRVLVSSDDTLRIHKFDHEGNILWEAPYLGYIDRNTALSGVSLRAEGGLWLAKYGLTMDGLEVWVEALDDDGNEIIGRHFVYSEPMEYRFGSLAPTKLFDLVSDRGNLWILPIDETEFGIQCLAEDGGRLLGGHGFLPGVVDNDRDPNYFKGLSDGDGGMWLSWIEDGTMVIHFDGNAEFDEGWSENGHVLWETGVSSINSQYLLDNGDLALMVTKTRSDGPMGPLGSGSSAYYIQHVRDFNQQTVGAHPELSPFKFGITKTYPNPFNQNAIINFSLPVEQIINLNLYDLSGRLVGIIAEGRFPADSHSVVYNKNQLPSGIYIARLEGQDNTHSVKMTLLR